MVGQDYLIICEINFLDHRCCWLSSDGRGFIDFVTEEIVGIYWEVLRNTGIHSQHCVGFPGHRNISPSQQQEVSQYIA